MLPVLLLERPSPEWTVARATRAMQERTRDRAEAAALRQVPALSDAWRKTLARASGVPAQVIFHDATLAAVAEARPASRDALLAVPGLGPLKIERYGELLEAWTITGLGHHWPGGKGRLTAKIAGPPSDTWDATAGVWAFFREKGG